MKLRTILFLFILFYCFNNIGFSQEFKVYDSFEITDQWLISNEPKKYYFYEGDEIKIDVELAKKRAFQIVIVKTITDDFRSTKNDFWESERFKESFSLNRLIESEGVYGIYFVTTTPKYSANVSIKRIDEDQPNAPIFLENRWGTFGSFEHLDFWDNHVKTDYASTYVAKIGKESNYDWVELEKGDLLMIEIESDKEITLDLSEFTSEQSFYSQHGRKHKVIIKASEFFRLSIKTYWDGFKDPENGEIKVTKGH
tara:strand:- start:4081 stop:4842 length:762 start_codon:yes stop_codon:yes gene_type:complete